ncbi:MAG: glycosyltransferase [Nitrososphaerota archaeon]
MIIIENISLNIQHHLDHLKKRGMYAALSNFNKSIQTIRRLFKDDISFVKEFLINSVNMNRINPNKPGFVYSMDGVPSFVVTGAFLATSLRKGLYILLQAPFKPLKDFVIDYWSSRVTFGGQNPLKEVARLLLHISQSVFSVSRYSYFYAFHNNLNGLLTVSDAPLILSGLNSWVNKRNVKLKMVRPAYAVDEKISKRYINEEERRRLLRRKEDVAVYYARLNFSKGLFDIIPIAKKLATEGYRLMVIGRFGHIVEETTFFRICKEKKLNNIEYLGWFPHEKLFDIVSRSKVLIYPSHSDTFSLVVLEALFLGCSVVAYDIPAIRSVYRGLKPVKVVKEYDYVNMAEEAIRMLKRDIAEHEEEHLDEDFMDFLRMHSSWRNVAKADIEAIKEMIDR